MSSRVPHIARLAQWRIVSHELGYPLYAAEIMPPAPPFSDREAEAFTYITGEDNPDIKLPYWRAIAKMHGLDPAAFNVEAV